MSGNCYMIFHTKLSWHDSETACKQTGANFASIASIRDQQFLAGNLTLKAPNTTIAEFVNTADPDETAHNEPSHRDLQCLPSSIIRGNE